MNYKKLFLLMLVFCIFALTGCGQVSVRESIESAIEERYGDELPLSDNDLDIKSGESDDGLVTKELWSSFVISGRYDAKSDTVYFYIDAPACNMENEIFAIMDAVFLCSERSDFYAEISATGADTLTFSKADVKDFAIDAKSLNLADRDTVINYMRNVLPDVYVDWYIDNDITSDQIILESAAMRTHGLLTDFFEAMGAPESSYELSDIIGGNMPDISQIESYLSEEEINLAKEELSEVLDKLEGELSGFLAE